ncbi:transcriptional regulator, ArsR family [Methanosarcina mazei Tuc01]|uniref:Transcriptional regulator, ArsR family n=1 Tax=Methanosarcina mazei Tuc01 TaxID=1236903 RepID=M1PB93_METMZ|nr:transcriptional regulator, ArsR family [Methanosarcina mazei Tuc01]
MFVLFIFIGLIDIPEVSTEENTRKALIRKILLFLPKKNTCQSLDRKRFEENRSVKPKTRHLVFTSIKLQKKLIVCLLFFLLTTIVGKANVLNNPNRDSVYTYIEANPGVCFSDIAKNTGLNRRTVQYHIQVLETQYKIEVYKEGGRIRCFQNSTYSEKEKKILVTSQNITNKRIISEILNGKCNTNVDLAREIGISKGTVSWYMKNLKEIGLIKETKRGRSIIYKINISYKHLIERYK